MSDSAYSVSAPVEPWVGELFAVGDKEFLEFQLSLPYGGCSLAAVCSMPDPHMARRLLKAWVYELSGYVEPIEDQLFATKVKLVIKPVRNFITGC